ncbi:MAG: hypothetical protein ILO36_08695 [Abditibacteriota bacterium]|nr:hypothetical protein [Abditibacteriota bacterium]
MEQNEQTFVIDWNNIPNMAYTKAYALKYGDDEEVIFTKSKTWMKMVKALANRLLKDHPGTDLSKFTIPGTREYFCYEDKAYLNWPIDLDNGMFFEGNLSAVKAVNLANALMDYFNADKSRITVRYLGRDAVPPEAGPEAGFRRAGEAEKLKMLMKMADELSPEGRKALAEWLNKE